MADEISYDRGEAARRAGVTVERLSQLIELGILQPGPDDRFTPGDVRKIGLVQSLCESGFPLEGLADVIGKD